MIQILVTLYILCMTVIPTHANPATVTEQVYSPDPTPVYTTIPTPEPTPQATPAPSPTPEVAPPDDDTPIDYIKELQKLGFIKDEYKDNDLNIRNGVIRFQSAHNLVVDGDFGPKSTAALKKRIHDSNYQYTDNVQAPASNGKWILINKSRRCLTLYEGNSVVKKYPVAVGNPPSLTPSGKYKIANMIVNPYWGGGGYAKPVQGGSPYNPLGYRWMGLNIGDGGSYGVHGNNSPYSIGTDASHGCIRMINSDVEELFEVLSISTPIWIATDDELKSLGIDQKEYGVDL